MPHVFQFRAIFWRFVERGLADFVVGNRNSKPCSELKKLLFVGFLFVVRNIATFAVFAQAITFNRLGQDNGRCASMVDGCFVGGINFFGIVSAAPHHQQFLVGVIFDEVEQLRILAEEMLADVRARHADVLLKLAIDDFAHSFHEQTGFILFQKRVPVVAPNDFDDVPASARKQCLKLLDNLPVPANRAIQALQVTVDHERQIVELFAGRKRYRTERFGLIAFAVAHESPNVLVRDIFDPAIRQIMIEAGLVDRHQRCQSHRHGRVFPKVRHQPRMRIRRQTAR